MIKWEYAIIFLISVFISSVSQVVLKKSAKQQHENRIKEYLNPRVIGAYGMFFLATLLTTLAYRGVPLSMGVILESTGYVYVAILGWVILKEKMNRYKVVGNVLIIAGILLFSM